MGKVIESLIQTAMKNSTPFTDVMCRVISDGKPAEYFHPSDGGTWFPTTEIKSGDTLTVEQLYHKTNLSIRDWEQLAGRIEFF